MSSASQQKKQSSKWGFSLQGAIAGIESRLDTILADEPDASARSRAIEEAAKQKAKLNATTDVSRDSSRSRTGGRLQDRLNKAVSKGADSPRSGSVAPSEKPSAAASPALGADTARTSIDSRRSETLPDLAEPTAEKDDAAPVEDAQSPATGGEGEDIHKPDTPQTPTLAVPSDTASPRSSLDSSQPRPSFEATTTPNPEHNAAPIERTNSTLEEELASLQKTYTETVSQQREELHAHLERIDALQSKLQYLAKQAAESAKQITDSNDASGAEKKLAEKDTQIAELLDEGQKLSKKELTHMQTIKKLRAKHQEDEKGAITIRQRLARAEKSAQDGAERARRAETAEKAAGERMKLLGRIEKDVETLKAEKEAADVMMKDLRKQLADAVDRADEAESKAQKDALEQERKTVKDLHDQLEDAKIERKLLEERLRKEMAAVREDAAKQQERAGIVELELKGEIQSLETKLEVLRSRLEELSSTGNSSTGSETQLLRQVETLQTQYSLASQNWQALESSLQARVAALEKERDDIAKREGDIRKKSRDVNTKSRRLEEELEAARENISSLEQDSQDRQEEVKKLRKRVEVAEKALEDTKAEFERSQKNWEEQFQQRIDEERAKWRLENANPSHHGSVQPLNDNHHQGYVDSPISSGLHRKSSADPLSLHSRRQPLNRTSSHELSIQATAYDQHPHSGRPSSRRTSTQPVRGIEGGATPPLRQDSSASLAQINGDRHRTPSIYTTISDAAEPSAPADDMDTLNSPQRSTIADLVSHTHSTSNTGPSVQLVERLSTAVRRLEAEKAASRDEMSRILAQRDDARSEMVALMKEIEEKRGMEERVRGLEEETKAMNARLEASLEMLGEKSERVEELENDVQDWKGMYKELVQRTVK